MEDITQEIVVLIEGGKVIMPAAMDPDQRDLFRVQALQFFTVPDGYEPITGTMNDVGMAVDVPDPSVRPEMKAKDEPYRENWNKSFHHLQKTVIGSVEDEVARFVVGGKLCSETTAQASAIQDHVMFRILFTQRGIHELHVPEHILLRALPGALAEATVIYQHHIIVVPVEILCIPRPSLDAPGIPMEVQDEACRLLTEEMQGIDADPRLHIEEIFPEWRIILELKVGLQLLRLEYEFLLEEIDRQDQERETAQNV